MAYKLFPEDINYTEIQSLEEAAKICRGAILTMTTLSGSGHPGGSMSSIDVLLAIYKYANINNKNFDDNTHDNVIVSIGHISPAVYACLGYNNFFPLDDAISQFRLAGSLYEGHIERTLKGVEWTTGNLGQGLSAACGMAVASKVKGISNFTYVLMGDGEQQKGQQSEARHFAAKYKLNNLIAILDSNKLQISGNIGTVMPQNIAEEYKDAGWDVFIADGHDYKSIIKTIREAQQSPMPSLVIANTTMGKGVPFIENQAKYHGSVLSEEEYNKAMSILNLEPELNKYKELRNKFDPKSINHTEFKEGLTVNNIKSTTYEISELTDCRSAYGNALQQIMVAAEKQNTDVIVYDCDLASSVKTNAVEKNYPNKFFQCGISEHHAAAASGASSVKGVIPFFSTFTMFAVDEVYNQLRMNDINSTNLKVVATHAGVDVGEDGRTHQCIDYIGLLKNLFGFKVLTPADPNQTDHILRYAAENYGNMAIIMGRSKVPVISKDDGTPFYDNSYQFEYGKVDCIRKGEYPLLTFGIMLQRALKTRDILDGKGISVGVYNVATPAYIDKEEIIRIASKGKIFVLEDHQSKTGLSSTISEIIASEGITCKVISFGVNKYAYSGTPDKVFELMNLDPMSVAETIKGSI